MSRQSSIWIRSSGTFLTRLGILKLWGLLDTLRALLALGVSVEFSYNPRGKMVSWLIFNARLTVRLHRGEQDTDGLPTFLFRPSMKGWKEASNDWLDSFNMLVTSTGRPSHPIPQRLLKYIRACRFGVKSSASAIYTKHYCTSRCHKVTWMAALLKVDGDVLFFFFNLLVCLF